jgi:hypothetical protein
MQTVFTDKDELKSIYNLRRQELFSNIYENIHGLGALLNIVDDLILSDKAKIQAKKLLKKPQCKLWKDYEMFLFKYIHRCYGIWYVEFSDRKKAFYSDTINYKNLKIIYAYLLNNNYEYIKPSFIIDDFIQMHRSNLIRKEIEREKEISKKIYDKILWLHDGTKKSIIDIGKYEKEQSKLANKISYHYRNLWPDCPADIPMTYDWRQ